MPDDVEVAVEGETLEHAEAPTVEDELGAIFDKANAEESEGPLRGPDGKFIAKDATAEGAEGETVTADQGAVAEEVKPATGLEPPASWSATAKASWPNLSPELQAEVLKRETDWQKADGERATRLKAYEPIAQVLEPVRQHLALNGVDEATYVRQLVAADQMLRQQPQQAIQQIARMYGINLQQLEPDQEELDPTIAPLVTKITQLESLVQNFATAQQQQQALQVQSAIETFMADPANKYAKQLEQQILAEIPTVNHLLPNASPAERLKKAYERAVRLDDGIQAAISAEKSAEAEAKRKEEAAKKATDAKRIAATNLSSKGTSAGGTPVAQSIEEELGAAYDRIQGAA